MYQISIDQIQGALKEMGVVQVGSLMTTIFNAIKKKLFYLLRCLILFMDEKLQLEKAFKLQNFEKRGKNPLKIQTGTTDKAYISLMQSNMNDEERKQKIDELYDPLIAQYNQSLRLVDEILMNKMNLLKMEPSKINQYLKDTVVELENDLQKQFDGIDELT